MLLAVVSDVHCNNDALEAMLAEVGSEVDEVLLAGDAVYEYRFSNEVLETVQRTGMRYITGNHEMVLLGPHGERARSAATVRKENLEFLQAVPDRIEVEVGNGKRLCMVHGSPWPPYNDYLTPGSRQLAQCGEIDADFLVLGHTHMAMVERVGRVLVINPGSISEPRDGGTDRRGSYAVIDTDSDEVQIRRLA